MRVLHGAEGQDRQRPGALRFLILEDNLSGAELIGSRLSEGGIGCELVRVQSRDTFTPALEYGTVDLILADHALSGSDGFWALRLARKLRPGVPFIFVSGTLGEKSASLPCEYLAAVEIGRRS